MQHDGSFVKSEVESDLYSHNNCYFVSATENELTAEDVASADMVILTKDIGIKFEERFAGKTIVRVNISDAVKRADAIMSKIEAHLAQTA